MGAGKVEVSGATDAISPEDELFDGNLSIKADMETTDQAHGAESEGSEESGRPEVGRKESHHIHPANDMGKIIEPEEDEDWEWRDAAESLSDV